MILQTTQFHESARNDDATPRRNRKNAPESRLKSAAILAVTVQCITNTITNRTLRVDAQRPARFVRCLGRFIAALILFIRTRYTRK